MPRPGQVDVEHVLPHVLRHGVERAVTADAGVGRDDVQSPESSDTLGEHPVQGGAVANVRSASDDPAACLLDETRSLGEVVGGAEIVGDALDRLAEVDCDDVGTLLCHPNSVASTLTPGGAGDEGDLALESPWHSCSSIVDAR